MGMTKDFSRAVLFESSSISLSSHPILPLSSHSSSHVRCISFYAERRGKRERREGKKDRNVGEGAFVVLELTVIALA